MRTLDDLDQKLLVLLTADARMPVAGLAASLRVARSTVQQRLARLERNGTIVGYTVRLGDVGNQVVRAHIALSADGRRLNDIIAAISAMGDVSGIWTTSGDNDLLVEVACPDTAHLDRRIDLIAEVPGVRRTTTSVLLASKLDKNY